MKIKFLAWNQLVGGVYGILIAIWFATHAPAGNLWLLFWVIMVLLFILSTAAGYTLLRGYEPGFSLSRLNQYLQLVLISVNGYTYEYIAGIGANAGLNLSVGSTITFNLRVSKLSLAISNDPTVTVVQVNLLALYFIVLLSNYNRKEKAPLEI